MSRPFENILPATNVKVEVYGVNSAKEVRALWSNEKLKFTVNEKGISFTVPKISFYEVVSIE
jgi:hypothetical protein